MADTTHPTFGKLIESEEHGLGCLAALIGVIVAGVLLLALGVGIYVDDRKIVMPIVLLLAGLFAIWAGIYLIRTTPRRSCIYEQGLLIETRKDVNEWPFRELNALTYTVRPLEGSKTLKHTLMLDAPNGKTATMMVVQNPQEGDSCLAPLHAVMQTACKALADHYQQVIESGGSVPWIWASAITSKGWRLASDREFPWEDLDYATISDETGDVRFYRKGQDKPINSVHCSASNFFPGWELFGRFVRTVDADGPGKSST